MMVMMMDSITAASRWWVITSVLRVGAAAGDWCSSPLALPAVCFCCGMYLANVARLCTPAPGLGTPDSRY